MRILIGFAKLTCLSFIVTASFGGINIEDFDKRERSLPYLTSDTTDEFDTVGQLVSYVKSTLVKKTDADIYASMQKHYEKLRLFKEGVWVHPTLQSRADELLPPLNSVKNCSALVDEMARVARGNPYLLSALNTMEETHLSALKEKALKDGAEILPDVVTYAMVLEKLTTAFAGDISLLETVDKVWDQAKQPIFVPKYFSPFLTAKYYTLSHLSSVTKAIKTRKVDPNYLSFGLPLNILEASITDLLEGHYANARAGWILAKHAPGGEYDPRTQSGPAYVANGPAGYPVLHIRAPLPKEWADLYATWNLGFVSSYTNFPYFMAKLLIPSVNNYAHNPAGYMYHRALPLYTHINYELFHRFDRSLTPAMTGWYSKELTHHFGRMNVLSAKSYQRKVKTSLGL